MPYILSSCKKERIRTQDYLLFNYRAADSCGREIYTTNTFNNSLTKLKYMQLYELLLLEIGN